MSILQALTAKPWTARQSRIDDRYAGRAAPASTRRLALQVFLAVVAVLFILLVVAYAGRMAYEDWRPAPQLRLLWANTAVLLLSSIFMQWAFHSARRDRRDAMRTGVLAAGAFTLVFLFGQVLAWRQLAAMVQFDFRNPAIGFFYLITGLHGLHLLGGLAAWSRTAVMAWSDIDPAKTAQSIGLCALYWHFLLAIWLVLFGLLFSGHNFELLLEICGIR